MKLHHFLVVVMMFGVAAYGGAVAHAQGECNVDFTFEERNGLLVVEIESEPAVSGWAVQTALSGFTGESYYRWDGSNSFDTPGNGLLEYKFRINTAGTYRFAWHNRIAAGNSSTDNNDAWLRFPDAANFFGENPSGSLVYPRDNMRGPDGEDLTPYPEGDSDDGWFKLYVNANGLGSWTWDSNTSDFDAHQVYVQFDSPGVYTMQVSARSNGHAIDRMVLFDPGRVTPNDAFNLANAETRCDTPAPEPNTIDVDEDGVITALDAIYVINRLGNNVIIGDNRIADVNNDDIIDDDDANAVIESIGTTLP
ncbi:MAG: hypothetical protein AAFV33_02910 [Chloroflexota bacterium]